jgi:hypothetical protein
VLSVASPGKPIENAISGTGGLDGAHGLDCAGEGATLHNSTVGVDEPCYSSGLTSLVIVFFKLYTAHSDFRSRYRLRVG